MYVSRLRCFVRTGGGGINTVLLSGGATPWAHCASGTVATAVVDAFGRRRL